jgi:hypothetical protein
VAQKKPVVQSASTAQLVLHLLAAPSQVRLPVHVLGVPRVQLPWPSQVSSVSWLFAQRVPHDVVAGGKVQLEAFTPSHLPAPHTPASPEVQGIRDP